MEPFYVILFSSIFLVGLIWFLLSRMDPKEMNVEFEDKLLTQFAAACANSLWDPTDNKLCCMGPGDCFTHANLMIDEYCKWTGLKRAVRKNK